MRVVMADVVRTRAYDGHRNTVCKTCLIYGFKYSNLHIVRRQNHAEELGTSVGVGTHCSPGQLMIFTQKRRENVSNPFGWIVTFIKLSKRISIQ